MAGTRKLQPSDREFFSDVARAVFTNPFSNERAEIDAKIGGGSPREDQDDRLIRVTRRVAERISQLDADGDACLNHYSGEDRDVLAFTFLFDGYHRCRDPFDKLISEQIAAGEAACQVPFAKDALDLLERRGFSPEEALRDFGLFYQIRRGSYFIGHALVGDSPSMKELRLNLWNNIFTKDIRWSNRYRWNRMENFSTLFLGETGTGKRSAATAIGRGGFIPFDPKRGCFEESFTRTFVSLNLSQFPETLIESELFGHEKGALTGAVEPHQGVFASCSHHVSIFLYEIGEVSVPVQIKLLQVVQERVFTPVGSHEEKRFRGRVISATNKTLTKLRGEGLFRDDFFYRLCSDQITVPPAPATHSGGTPRAGTSRPAHSASNAGRRRSEDGGSGDDGGRQSSGIRLPVTG